MTLDELLARFGGGYVSARARILVDGNVVVVARLEDSQWKMTEDGLRIMADLSNQVEEPKKTRKPRAAAVESAPEAPVDAPAEVAAEADSAPETVAE